MARVLSENEWIDDYKPQPAPNAGNGFDFGNGCTLVDGHQPGDEDYLRSVGENRIWTVVDGDESTAVAPGRHHVNCLGYIVTEEPWTNDIVEVELED